MSAKRTWPGRTIENCPADAVELTIRQVCLLLALRDFPQVTAPSRGAWVRAAWRYLRQVARVASYRRMAQDARALPERFVLQQYGPCGIEAVLRPRGRRLAEGQDRLFVPRLGLWPGFDAVADRVAHERDLREAAERRRGGRARRMTYREAGMRNWLARTPMNLECCSLDAPALTAEDGRPPLVQGLAGTRAFVRAELWGGPCDGEPVVLGLHPAPDLVFETASPDRLRAKVRYVMDRDPVYDALVLGVGERVPSLRELAARLRGRGVRYRMVGML